MCINVKKDQLKLIFDHLTFINVKQYVSNHQEIGKHFPNLDKRITDLDFSKETIKLKSELQTSEGEKFKITTEAKKQKSPFLSKFSSKNIYDAKNDLEIHFTTKIFFKEKDLSFYIDL